MAKPRMKPRDRQQQTGMTISTVTGKTNNQQKILDSDKNILIHGHAGTGKSFLSLYKALKNRETSRVRIIRSIIPTRDIGHLPGSYEEKIKKYETPYINIVNKLYGCGTAYDSLKARSVLEFETTSYLRGDTFSNMSVVVDECQNMTFHELDSIITRADDNVKFFFCGDCLQSDLKNNGFGKFIKVLQNMPQDYDFFEMEEDDIVRGEMMKRYILSRAKLGF